MTDWCPTQNGQITGYVPEYNCGNDEKWLRIPVNDIIPDYVIVDGRVILLGAPPPKWTGGILQVIGLYGYAQAQALAWLFAAEASHKGEQVEVRVVSFEVHYEIKARKLEEQEKCHNE